MKYMKLFALLLMIYFAPAVFAQTDCPSIVKAALSAADSSCSTTGRNQACYGNITLSAVPREGAADFQFSHPGDKVDVIGLQSLQLSSMDENAGQWGVAVMRLQANLPDTLPGQNVTFLLFGDVSVTDAGNQAVEVPVTATGAVNVRQLPRTNASVLRALKKGQEVMATGRLPDSSWIQIRLDDGSLGWVSADFLNGDLPSLLPTEPGAPAFGPMQAFYFTTGYADSPCETAPDSGILIQTPKGAGTIELRANNVDIQLGSTVYLQAVPGNDMYVSVIEGHATLTADGETQIVPAGTAAAVPLNASGAASGPPGFPETYDPAALQALPLDVALPQEVTITPAIAEADIPGAIDIVNGLPPNNGHWVYTQTTTHIPLRSCGLSNVFVLGNTETLSTTIVFSDDRSTMALRDLYHEPQSPGNRAPLVLYRSSETSYGASYFSGDWVITFSAPTTFSGTTIGWRQKPECSWDRALAGVYQP
jgi:Bacterial SH3 domain